MTTAEKGRLSSPSHKACPLPVVLAQPFHGSGGQADDHLVPLLSVHNAAPQRTNPRVLYP
jgi:hypothetical protein